MTGFPVETVRVKLLWTIAGRGEVKVMVWPAIPMQSIVSPEAALRIALRRVPAVAVSALLVTDCVAPYMHKGSEKAKPKIFKRLTSNAEETSYPGYNKKILESIETSGINGLFLEMNRRI